MNYPALHKLAVYGQHESPAADAYRDHLETCNTCNPDERCNTARQYLRDMDAEDDQ